MRRVEAILAAVMTTTLAGCVVGGKPKTVAAAPPPPQPAAVSTAPAPPPAPLSIAQTQVVLPPPQPLDPEALPDVSPPEQPADSAPVVSGQRTTRGTRQPAAPKPAETAPLVGPPPAAPPAVDAHPPIQEMVPASEQKRLQDSAQARRKEILQWLETVNKKRMNRHQQSTVVLIRGFLKESDDAEKRNDMRQADALAERAQILMRELQNAQ